MEENAHLTIFHTLAWKRLIEEVFGFEPFYRVVRDVQGNLVGIAPAFIANSFRKRVLVSMPFFEYGGPWVLPGHEKAYAAVFAEYRHLVDTGRIDQVKVRSLPEEADYGEVGFAKSLEGHSYRLDLTGKTFDQIWEGFSKRQGVRTKVRKMVRQGVEIHHECDLDTFYELVKKKDARLGSPSFARSFYESLNRHMADKIFYTAAVLDGTPLGSIASLRFRDVQLLHQSGCDLGVLSNFSMDLLLVEQIRAAWIRRCRIVDFGRSRPGSSHEQFKLKYGCRRRDIYLYSYPPASKPDRYAGRRLAQSVIRSAPRLFGSTALGSWLRKNAGL